MFVAAVGKSGLEREKPEIEALQGGGGVGRAELA